MSEALIGCQPRIDEPSNMIPSSNSPTSRRFAGIVVCCHTPGKSMNLRSRNLTSCFLASSSTSFGVIFPPKPARLAGRSNRFLTTLARTDADGLFDRDDEDLSVPNATRFRAFLDGVEYVVYEFVR